MTTISVLSILAMLLAGGLVFYALHKKGDVRAVLSHGKTVLKLEAKDRNLLGK